MSAIQKSEVQYKTISNCLISFYNVPDNKGSPTRSKYMKLCFSYSDG